MAARAPRRFRPQATGLRRETDYSGGSAPYLAQSWTAPKQPNSRPPSPLRRASILTPSIHREPLAQPCSRPAPLPLWDPLKFSIASYSCSRGRDNKYLARCRLHSFSGQCKSSLDLPSLPLRSLTPQRCRPPPSPALPIIFPCHHRLPTLAAPSTLSLPKEKNFFIVLHHTQSCRSGLSCYLILCGLTFNLVVFFERPSHNSAFPGH